jgi:hypothetical protein
VGVLRDDYRRAGAAFGNNDADLIDLLTSGAQG